MADSNPLSEFEARKLWNPTLARIYGIKPWEMPNLLPSELEAINEDIEEINRANG